MDKILSSACNGYLRLLRQLADECGTKAYLTGGAVRDMLLGRENKDLDFTLAAHAGDLPLMFSGRIGGSFFWLDRERQQSRVVKRVEDEDVTFDFAPLRGPDIAEDLRLRDFTVNAMAMEVSDSASVIDPFHGQDDVQDRIIRMSSPACFDDDPLRLLRAVRFSAVLGFTIEKVTRHDIKDKAHLLERVAAERIRDEFMQILSSPGIETSLVTLLDLGLFRMMVPLQLRTGFTDAGCSDGIHAAARVEETSGRLPGEAGLAARELDRQVEYGVTALSLVKLAAFIAGATPGRARQWGERLRLGRGAAHILAVLSRQGGSVPGEDCGERVLFRYIRDHQPASLEVALFDLSRGAMSPKLWDRLVRYRYERYQTDAPDLLLSGEEVMDIMGVSSGPAVGEAMERLRQGEASGAVRSREEAEAFLRKNLLTNQEPMR